jgi:hypothetical protein
MISKNTSLLIIIAAIYALLSVIGIQAYWISRSNEFSPDLMGWVSLAVMLSSPVVLALLAGSLVHETAPRRKLFALFFTLLTGLGLCVRLYYRTVCFSSSFDSQYASNFLWYFVQVILTLLFPVSMLLTGIALMGDRPGRIKKAAVWLIGGSLIAVFETICSRLARWIGYGFHYTSWSDGILDIVATLELIFPIALILLGVALYKRFDAVSEISFPDDAGPVSVSDDLLLDEATPEKIVTPIPSVMSWLRQFLLISIPLAGVVLLIIWATDHENRVRRNWSIATFLISIFSAALNLFVFVPFLLDVDPEDIDFTIPAMLLIFMIIVGSVLIYKYAHQRQFESKQDDANPSVMLWISNFIIVGIPIIGLICLIIWATEKRNLLVQKWAKARLIWMGIMFVFGLFLYTMMLEIAHMKPFIYFQF